MSGKPVTQEEKEAILEVARQSGYSYAAISQQLGIPFQRLHHIIKSYLHSEWNEGKRAYEVAQGPESKPSRAFRDILDVPVPRYATEVTARKKGKAQGKWRHAVVYTDSHHPFHDPQAVSIVLSIIKDVRPNLVAHLGDLLDCYTISRFGQNPARIQTLQDDIDTGRRHLHQVADAANGADLVLLEGNHEDRLRKVIWNLEGAARELPRLRVFQQAMTWPVLLDLGPIGWEFVPYSKQPVFRIPRLLFKHGDVARKHSGYTARAEWEKHAKSGMSGHTHRLGTYYHRDLNGSHVWHEGGCTCLLDPEYVRQPDWQHAVYVVTYSDDWYQAQPVYVERGVAVWRDREFAA